LRDNISILHIQKLSTVMSKRIGNNWVHLAISDITVL